MKPTYEVRIERVESPECKLLDIIKVDTLKGVTPMINRWINHREDIVDGDKLLICIGQLSKQVTVEKQ